MIEVENLSFAYSGADKDAVSNLSFAVEPGQIFGFLGPSGAGKSTTQKILFRLLRDYRGSVRVFGREVALWRSEYYERIGVSFEFPNHYLKLTGLENLKYFGALYASRRRRPEELLAMVGLAEDAKTLVARYSKGMKTRLGVARALLHEPELLFMDEPTAGLDPVSARSIKDIIKGQRGAGKTVFLTTHDMATVDELCDRAAFIVGGEIRLIDNPRSLKLRYGAPSVKVEYLENGARVAVDFPLAGLGRNAAFLELLRQHDVQTLHTQEATLEDVFIEVTGQSLTSA